MKKPFLLALLLNTAVIAQARADSAGPEDAVCYRAGQSCMLYGAAGRHGGVCVTRMCTRRPSQPPGPTEYECVVCEEGTPSDESVGCTVGGTAVQAIGPWVLAGLFGAAVTLVRRRRSR